MTRAILAAGAALAALAAAAPASAAGDPQLEPSGALTYVWHGDPARGCARVGVCGISGELILRPSGSVDYARGSGRSALLSVGSLTLNVRVRRSDPGSEGTCIDIGDLDTGFVDGISAHWNATGAVRARVSGTISSGRCAGPLAADFNRVRLSGRYRGGAVPHFDLRGTTPFAGGPYSGTVTSTLRLGPWSGLGGVLFGNPSQADGASDRPTGSASGPGRRMEQLVLTYRVAVIPGALRFGFDGALDPLCVPFDACATSGDVAVGLGPATATVSLMASRPAPRRPGRAEALRAFAAGGFPMVLPGQIALVPAQVSESLARIGGPVCSDQRRTAVSIGFGGAFSSSASRQPLTVSSTVINQPLASDPLRTYCPGPESADLLPLAQELARAAPTPTQLAARHTTVALSAGGAFSGGGYRGTRGGAVTVSVTLQDASVSTYRDTSSSAHGARR